MLTNTPINSSNVVSENINKSSRFKYSLSINYDTTNDILYPTSGMRNNFSFDYYPEFLSDEPLYKLHLNNDLFFNRKMTLVSFLSQIILVIPTP